MIDADYSLGQHIMCRFLTYSGPAILMESLLVHADNSLIVQSHSAKRRAKPVNGDGFGIGWYPVHEDPIPGTFVSVEPAWSNRNLRQLAAKIFSHCFFAHVRDASIGMPVTQTNCHPFQQGRYLWMHNGRLDQFGKIRRKLINGLSDRAFQLIQGTTDSEHAFALFLDQITFNEKAGLEEMRSAMISTLDRIMRLRLEHGVNTNASMNFGVSNGLTTVVTRFSSHSAAKPASLFYAKGRLVQNEDGDIRIIASEDPKQESLIIASEPLTDVISDWSEVKPNHMLVTNQNIHLTIEPIPLPFQDKMQT